MIKKAGLGYEFKYNGERISFYLYDPEARSESDIINNLSNSAMFHVKSNISGKVLPFINLSKLPEQSGYQEVVKDNIREILAGKASDTNIERIFPNIRTGANSGRPPFSLLTNSGDFTSKFTGSNWLSLATGANRYSGNTGKAIGEFHSLKDLYERGVTQLSHLHNRMELNRSLPIAATNKLFGALESIKNKSKALQGGVKDSALEESNGSLTQILESNGISLTRSRLSSLQNHINNLEELRKDLDSGKLKISISSDGSAYQIADKYDDDSVYDNSLSGTTFSQHTGERLVRELRFATANIFEFAVKELDPETFGEEVKQLLDVYNTLLRHGPDGSEVLKAIISGATLDPERVTLGELHDEPDVVAATEMVFGDNPLVSNEEFRRSGSFGLEGMFTLRKARGSTYSPASQRLFDISSAENNETARNLSQIYQRLQGSCLGIDLNINYGFRNSPFGLFESSLSRGTESSLAQRLLSGESPRTAIPKSLISNTSLISGKEVKLSKRDVENYFNNVVQCDRIMMAAGGGISLKSAVTMRTPYGESISVVPSGGESQQISIEFCDANNDLVFSQRLGADPAESAQQIFFHPKVIFSLPPGKIKSMDDLKLVTECLWSNDRLMNSVIDGYMCSVAGVRDSQGRKMKRSEFLGWVDDVIKHPEQAYMLYKSQTYKNDAESIAIKIAASAFLGLAQDAGFSVSSERSLNEVMEGKADQVLHERFLLDGLGFNFEFMDCHIDPSLSGSSVPLNYKKHIVDTSRRIHSESARIFKSTRSSMTLDWPPATPVTSIGTLASGERVMARPLHSYQSIQDEGADMNHCVGGYALMCAKGEYYAWSIVAVDHEGRERKLSTLGMEHLDGYLVHDQHYGFDNQLPTPEIEDMVRQFSDKLTASIQPPSDYSLPGVGREISSSEYLPSENAIFTPTQYETELDSEDSPLNVVELIVGYDWQSDAFKKQAVDFLKRHYGEKRVLNIFNDQIDVMIRDAKVVSSDFIGSPDPRQEGLEDFKRQLPDLLDVSERIEMRLA